MRAVPLITSLCQTFLIPRLTWKSFSVPPPPLLVSDGRIIIVQPRRHWLSFSELKHFVVLAGLEVVKAKHRFGPIRLVVARRLVSGNQTSSLSIIVPARNEAGTVAKIVRELPTLGKFTEIIFIEGHSQDQTLAEIERVIKNYRGDKRLIHEIQRGVGKGDAVRQGFDLARGDILMIYDADMTVPPEEITKFYRAIVENRGEFINGSRLVYPMKKQSMRFLNYLGNRFFSLAFSYILGQPLGDTLCGTKVLWRKDYEDIKNNRAFFGDFDPFGDFDLLFGAAKLNRKIIDLPVHYRDRVYGTTNISRWTHGWLLLKMTVFAWKKFKFIR